MKYSSLKKHFVQVLAALALSLLVTTAALAQAGQSVVIYFFWGDGCPHCEAAKPALRALAQRYGVEMREYEVWNNAENQAFLGSMAAAFDFDPRYVPTIFVADHYWEGYSETIEAEIEAVITACLETACPDPAEGLILPENGASQETTPPSQVQSDGLGLAIIVMLAMIAVVAYAFVYIQGGLRKRRSRRAAAETLPQWQHIGTLVLSLIGLGVAGYLAYVETQAVPAVCGPVGDCNAVQSSPYARLFGVLPVGVLGVAGYLAILAAWLYPQLRRDRYSAYMPVVNLAMTSFGVVFSLYLTFLEIFIIRAVCMWCVTSAVIMALLLLLSLKPALLAIKALRKKR